MPWSETLRPRQRGHPCHGREYEDVRPPEGPRPAIYGMIATAMVILRCGVPCDGQFIALRLDVRHGHG